VFRKSLADRVEEKGGTTTDDTHKEKPRAERKRDEPSSRRPPAVDFAKNLNKRNEKGEKKHDLVERKTNEGVLT